MVVRSHVVAILPFFYETKYFCFKTQSDMTLEPALNDKHGPCEDTNKTDNTEPSDIKNSSPTKHVTFKLTTDTKSTLKKPKNVDDRVFKIIVHKIGEVMNNNKEEVKELVLPGVYLESAAAILVATAKDHNQLTVQESLETIKDLSKPLNIETLGTKALNILSDLCHGMSSSIVNSIHQTVDKVGLKKISEDFSILCKQAAVYAQEDNLYDLIDVHEILTLTGPGHST